jgi:hypothetical protein
VTQQRPHIWRYIATLVAMLKFILPLLGLNIASPGAAAIQEPAQRDSERVLVEGNPALTQRMVDQRMEILELFLEIKISQERRGLLQRELVQAWKQGDQEKISGTLEDVKLYGKEKDILALRTANQSSFVDSLRKKPNDPMARELLEIYDAAHPERKDFMRTHGMGELVGEWKRIDYLAPQTNPNSHEAIGISFTDSLIFTVYPDGHFRHFWVHSHCGSRNTCCDKYSTDVKGTVIVEGGQLVLKAETGTQLFDAPCNHVNNSFGQIQPHEERFASSIKPAANSRMTLCLATQPFDPRQEGPGKAVCYEKKPGI